MAAGVLGDGFDLLVTIMLIVCVLIGLGITVSYWFAVKSYDEKKAIESGQPDEGSGLKQPVTEAEVAEKATEVYALVETIEEGADAFLFAEYRIMAVFMFFFAILVFVFTGLKGHVTFKPSDKAHIYSSDWVFGAFSTISFIVGALTSIFAGYVGMAIATCANGRVTMKCYTGGLNEGFKMAFKGGMVMGFGLLTMGLANLMVLIGFFKLYYTTCEFYNDCDQNDMYDALAAYGLGGSSIALFGRVGGGIYTKAADVGADLAGKVDNAIPEDSPKNPATIADNVGDNVGDIAGMGSDLFGSFAEGTCAAMVIMASSNNCVFYADGAMNAMVSRWSSMCFPIAITATGLVVSFITSLFATHCGEVETEEVDPDDAAAMSKTTSKVEYALKKQLCISTVLMTPVVFLIAAMMLPETFWVEARIGQFGTAPTADSANKAVCEGYVFPPIKQKPLPFPITAASGHAKPFTLADFTGKHCLGAPDVDAQEVQWWQVAFTVVVGLWAGLVIGFVTEYYTSNTYQPVKEVAASCEKGAAVNIIYGLALGYKSAVVPCIALAVSIYVGYAMSKMLGVACAALGMLSTMAICLTIDGYGPIADNAGGIAEMAELPGRVRQLTDSLDAAGNTTAAIGKGFAIGSAAMVALALFSGYCVRADIKNHDVSVLEPMTFFGLLIGSMLPYAFSAMTMKSVGLAAEKMVDKVREQFNSEIGKAILAGEVDPKDKIKLQELQKKFNDTSIEDGDWYGACIKVATNMSLQEMIAPGALVMLSPLFMGILFGKYALSGLLVGGIVSGVQMAVSASNTGGAWDNAKKQIEQENKKGTPEHMAAVIGDTVGDPLKDTSGPAVNILMKLMAIIALVFAPFIAALRDGYGLIGCSLNQACKA
jgi:inorganic pyrophosphatase